MKKVIITGADGYVASRIIPHLETKYKLTLVDIDFKKTHSSETIKFDICNSSLSELNDITKNHDAIIHLAYVRPEKTRDPNNLKQEIELAHKNQMLIMKTQSRLPVLSTYIFSQYHEHPTLFCHFGA